MEKSNIKVIKLTPEYANVFEDLYKGSALTFEGVIPEEAHCYREFFKQFTEVDESQPCYLFSGKMMNDYYGLTGTNAYPDDLNILSFPLMIFKEVARICLPRFQLEGRWFDDIVENNKRRQKEIGY